MAALMVSSTVFNTADRQGGAGSGAAGNGSMVAKAHEAANDMAPWSALHAFLTARARIRPVQLKFLIATVPDPVDTHLSIFFDRAIESLQNAASTAGYDFDRYWIPWRENPYSATPDPLVRAKQEEEKRKLEYQPGLLLFRGQNDKPDLAVFLVGETPTGGVETAQFNTAVNFILNRSWTDPLDENQVPRYEALAPASGDPPILVVGPSFSGSLPSLGSAIQFADTNPNSRRKTASQAVFKIISGSTSSGDAEIDFKNGLRKNSSFASAVHPDDNAMCAFLNRIGGAHPLVAVLSEGDTALGAELRNHELDAEVLRGAERRLGRLKEGTTEHLQLRQKISELRGASQKETCRGEASNVEVINFTFPRDIARLRNAYHDDFLATPVPDKYKAFAPEGVTLTLKDSNTGHDTVPSFSHEHTPLAQEATLMNLAVALRRNEVQYAGVVATDPLDAYFLSRFLAANAPNVRVFQLDADLMFVREPESTPLAGMLAITTYPLMAQNQQWTNRGQAWRIFSSRFSQGVYNAALALLRDPKPEGQTETDYSQPLLEYDSPFRETTSRQNTKSIPLWLTAAGRNGYWPIELLATRPSELMLKPEDRDQLPPVNPGERTEPVMDQVAHVFAGSVWAVALLIFWGAFALWRGAHSRDSKYADFRTKVSSAAEIDKAWQDMGGVPYRRAAYILLCVLAVGSIFLCLTGPHWRLLGLIDEWENVLPVAIGLAAFVYALRRLLPQAMREDKFTAGAGVLGFLLLLWVGVYLLTHNGRHQDFFLAYRSVNLSSGLAPNLPLAFVIAAFACWARVHWQRRILVEERSQDLPTIGSQFAANGTDLFRDSAAAVQNSLGKSCTAAELRWGAVAVGAAVFWISLSHLRTLEAEPFLWLYSGLLGTVCGLVILAVAQFFEIWRMLERLLEEIEFHPVRLALSALPPDRTWSPMWQSSVSKRNHVLLTRSVDCLRAIGSKKLTLSGDLAALDQATAAVLRRRVAGENEAFEQKKASQICNRVANDLAGELEWIHWQRGSAESPKLSDFLTAGEDMDSQLKGEFVALRVLAFIRYVMLHLRNLLGFLTTGFVLVLASLESYPFQSPHMIASLTLALFAVIGVTIVWVFHHMDKNQTLRRITESDDGKAKGDWSYWLKLAEAGAVPLVALIASNIPGAGKFLFSWLGPVLDKLH